MMYESGLGNANAFGKVPSVLETFFSKHAICETAESPIEYVIVDLSMKEILVVLISR